MARPIYETDHDLSEEAKIALRMANGKETFKLGPRYELDYAVGKPGSKYLESFLECKRRNIPHTKYDTYIISAAKIVFGLNLGYATDLPVFLCIQWDDAIGHMNYMTKSVGCFMGGRYDRGDEHDIEPMLEFSLEDFVITVDS